MEILIFLIVILYAIAKHPTYERRTAYVSKTSSKRKKSPSKSRNTTRTYNIGMNTRKRRLAEYDRRYREETERWERSLPKKDRYSKDSHKNIMNNIAEAERRHKKYLEGRKRI